MNRMIAAVFAASLLIASPALAQSLTDLVAATLAAQGLTLDTASQAEITAATEAVFDSALDAQLAIVGIDPATATGEQLALAAAALVANNSGLSDGAVGALTSAAVKRNPGAATQIVSQVVAQRPAAAVAITRAAVDAAPTQVNQIAAAASQAAINGGQRDLVGAIVTNAVAVANDNGVGTTIENVAAAVGAATGIEVATLVDEANSAQLADNQELFDQDEEEEDLVVEENPAQDASPA